MTRRKSENRVVPHSRGNPASTKRSSRASGGKAIPVDEAEKQLELFADTAERPAQAGVDGEAVRRVRPTASRAAPQSANKREQATPATIRAAARRLSEAFENVARNRGAPGPDGRTIKEVRKHWPHLRPELEAALLEGSYEPGNIRRKWIPKAGGGERGLGIPDVIDRVVQEAVRLELEPLYEPTFHASSHGFRPRRGCHTAIAEAVGYVKEGYERVVDIDLEKFFDRVNHQRLMSRLALRVKDRAMLELIGRMLKAKAVLPDGVIVNTEEGVPQGGPLSPLLSNIVLDELDQELARRGHRFVRYADDCNIYVRSERAGQRVMASIQSFIERRLRLKVNETKSAVARPQDRHFLGFRLQRRKGNGEVDVLLSRRSKERIYAKLRELIPRSKGASIDRRIEEINRYLVGWIAYFGICTGREFTAFAAIDAHVRRRLRAMQLKQWKRKRTIARKLIGLGVRRRSAWRSVYDGRKSLWALTQSGVVTRALSNSHWEARSLVSVRDVWRKMRETIVARDQQLQLNLA